MSPRDHRLLLISVIINCCAISCGFASPVLPEINFCHRDDPALNDCLKNSIQNFLPRLRNSLPYFDLPVMDPWVTEDAKLNYSMIEAFVGKLSVYEVYSYGLSTGEVQSVVANITDKNVLKLSIDIFFPEGKIKGHYEGTTRVGILPFYSGGPFNLTTTKALLNWKIKAKVKKVNGTEYMKVRTFKFKPVKIANLKVNLEGIFPSKQLTRSTVKLINGSWGFFMRQLMPETQSYFGPALVNILNKIFMKIPYDRLLPKNSASADKIPNDPSPPKKRGKPQSL